MTTGLDIKYIGAVSVAYSGSSRAVAKSFITDIYPTEYQGYVHLLYIISDLMMEWECNYKENFPYPKIVNYETKCKRKRKCTNYRDCALCVYRPKFPKYTTIEEIVSIIDAMLKFTGDYNNVEYKVVKKQEFVLANPSTCLVRLRAYTKE